jgi:hypothetical protein
MVFTNNLSTGQRDVIDMLTFRARIATRTQLERLPGNASKSRSWIAEQIRRLHRRGLIERQRTALRLPRVDNPIFAWGPGDAVPGYESLVWQLEKRYRVLRPQTAIVYWATPRAADMFGGTARRPGRGDQFEHDLGLAEAYLARTQQDPGAIVHWISEDLLRQRFSGPLLKCIPDAAILSADGTIDKLIEFGGQYSAKRLRAFHAHCEHHVIPYELW